MYDFNLFNTIYLYPVQILLLATGLIPFVILLKRRKLDLVLALAIIAFLDVGIFIFLIYTNFGDN